MTRSLRRAAFLAALLLPACGGNEAPTADADQVPVRDTTVPPIERQPFGAADEVGLEPLNLSVELPWTSNQLSRDPADAAAPVTLLAMETLTTADFDRAIFTFSRDAPFPGYRVRVVPHASELACDETEEHPLEGDGPVLAVTLAPARAEDVSAGMRETGQSRFQAAGLACDGTATMTWTARLAEAGEVRVLELRDPQRLVVDLR